MNKKISFSILFFAMLACALPGAAPLEIPQQAVDVDSLQTIIVLTANAAQTQTAKVIPTSTFTLTATRTPSSTPTPTVTFLFLFPTYTLFPTQTPIGQISTGGGGAAGTPEKSIYTGHPWSCRVQSSEPPKWAVLQKGQEFYAYWTILNTGTKTWTRTTIDLVYTGGYRHDGTKIIDITESGGTGSTVRVGTKFIAPKSAGEYSSYFSLQVGSRRFCGMSILFVINE